MTTFSSKSLQQRRTLRNQQQRWSCVRTALLLYISWQSIHLVLRLVDVDETTATLPQEQQQRLAQASSTTGNAPNVVYHSRKEQQHVRKEMEATPDDFEVTTQQAPSATEKVTKPNDSKTPAAKKETATASYLPHHGTGPAKQGYIIDAVADRARAPFRDVTVVDHTTKVQGLLQQHYGSTEKSYAACPTTPCSSAAVGLYNPSSTVTRYVKLSNGTTEKVAPESLLPLNEKVSVQSVSVEPVASKVHIVPYSDRTKISSTQLKDVTDCTTPCRMAASLTSLLDSEHGITELSVGRYPEDDYKFLYTMEDPYANARAKIEKTAYQAQTYYATQSWKSAVPLSQYRGALEDVVKALAFAALPAKAVYLANDNCGAARRNKWQAAVNAVLPVVAYGQCDHNTPLPSMGSLTTEEGRIQLYQGGGRIALILETGIDPDIVTRQVWEALQAGTVPAIYGATNLKERLPHHSAIVHADFTNWDTFAAHVAQVANDQQLWEAYHAWRTDPVELARVRDMYAFTKISPICRICAWADAKHKGLEWNHAEQKIVESFAEERKLCVAGNDALVTAPFQEAYEGHALPKASSSKSCTTEPSTLHIGPLQRTVVSPYDGVIDFTFSNEDKHDFTATTVLTLTFPNVHNMHGAFFRHPHTRVDGARRTPWVSSVAIQDRRTKVTVLSDGVMDLTSPSEGVIRIPVQSHHERLRVIVEHVDGVQDKMTEFFPSPFGQRMMLDFVDPVEYYAPTEK